MIDYDYTQLTPEQKDAMRQIEQDAQLERNRAEQDYQRKLVQIGEDRARRIAEMMAEQNNDEVSSD